jgi:hypothetical protein
LRRAGMELKGIGGIIGEVRGQVDDFLGKIRAA